MFTFIRFLYSALNIWLEIALYKTHKKKNSNNIIIINVIIVLFLVGVLITDDRCD